MSYPPKMAVIAADFVIVDADPRPLVYLSGFSILKVERIGRSFKFDEARRLDETGTASAALLHALTSELDADTSLAGHRLDRLIASLVRVPCDDPNDAKCKPALLRLQAALANEVVDTHWLDRDRHRSLEVLARDYDLPAEWHRPSRNGSPNQLDRELSAKVQCSWLSIAHEWLTNTDLRRATADYDQWRTAHSIT